MVKKFFRDHSIHKKIAPFFDELFFLNPMNYYFSWLMICTGIYLNLFLSDLSPQFLFSFNSGYVFLFVGLSFLLSSIYINKEITKSSSRNKTFNFIKEKYSITKIIIFLRLLSIVGVLILFFASWINALIGLLLCLLGLVINQLFKNKIVYYFIESIILFFSGWYYTCFVNTSRSIIVYDLLFIFPYFILCYCIHISKLKSDNFKNNGIEINKYDFKLLLSLILILLCFFMGVSNNDPLLSIISITSAGFYFYSVLRAQQKDIIRSFVYPLALFNIFLMTIFPYLFIFHYILFYISKYYYWHRFNIHYPTFLVDNE